VRIECGIDAYGQTGVLDMKTASFARYEAILDRKLSSSQVVNKHVKDCFVPRKDDFGRIGSIPTASLQRRTERLHQQLKKRLRIFPAFCSYAVTWVFQDININYICRVGKQRAAIGTKVFQLQLFPC